MSQKKIKVEVTLTEKKVTSLIPNHQKLVKKALLARQNSYAPYSNFPVGAAVLLQNETYVIGNNQENAAYPSGLCAERTALFACRANYPKQKVLALAICVRQSATHVPFPCGGCLQVIAEVEQNQDTPITIFLIHNNQSTVWEAQSVKQLLPFAFGPKHLLS
jgi:cytidine deaminase